MPESSIISPDFRDLELNALLEVTQAINNNLSEESLYKIYRFTLLAGLKIKKLALFVQNEQQWTCMVHFGVSEDFVRNISLQPYLDIEYAERIVDIDESCRPFETVIPVRHKERLLAVVFIGEMEESQLSTITRSSTTFLEALTNITLVAIENKKLARRQLEQESLRKELEIAKQVQQFLFPKELPNNKKLEIDAFYRPHHDIGGDYYDYIKISDDKFLVCIADVSGKGVPAALMMSNFQASLRTLVRQSQDLELIVKELNYQLSGSGNSEIFITFFVAVYNTVQRTMQYVNCGHNPPFLLDQDKKRLKLDTGTTVMGMFEPLPFFELGSLVGIESFDLLLYTDGLTETVNRQGDELGEEKVEDLFYKHSGKEPDQINTILLNAAEDFRGNTPYRDDITLMAIKSKA